MSGFAKFAMAAAAVVVVAVVGYNLLGAAGSGQVGSGPSPSAKPSSSPPPLVLTTGPIDQGRYRWTSPAVDVSLTLSDGWTGRSDGLEKRADTTTEMTIIHSLPGSREVNHVFSDACFSGNALEPIGQSVDDLVAALDAQGSTDVVVRDISAGSVVGKRVEIREASNVDRSQCRHGTDGPLQIWADADENGYYAFGGDSLGVAYVFEVDGNRLVFAAAFGSEGTEADVDEVDAIVQSFEFTPR